MGANKGKNNGGGRKAIPASLIDPSKTHKSYEEIEARKKIESKLITESSEILIPPPSMSPAAKKEWNRMIALYNQMPTKILCDLDLQILKFYCEMVASYDEASKIIKKVKKECKDNNIQFRLSMVDTELKIQSKCTAEIRALTEQLCLSPLARARLGVVGAQNSSSEKSSLDALFEDD